MTHLSLFSGIGGIDLAAHWAGFQTIQFVERDKFCQKVLAKRWPSVPIHDDITTFDAKPFRGRVALISGGFPCQDISAAGKGAGVVAGARSALWFHMLRIVRDAEPLFVLAENVPALRTRGADRVLAGLEEAGYTSIALVVGAGSAGAPHKRMRVFIVAANPRIQPNAKKDSAIGSIGAFWATRNDDGWRDRRPVSGNYWAIHQPGVWGVANGVPNRVDRLRALGNAVVPQQVYPLLAAIAKEIQGVKR